MALLDGDGNRKWGVDDKMDHRDVTVVTVFGSSLFLSSCLLFFCFQGSMGEQLPSLIVMFLHHCRLKAVESADLRWIDLKPWAKIKVSPFKLFSQGFCHSNRKITNRYIICRKSKDGFTRWNWPLSPASPSWVMPIIALWARSQQTQDWSSKHCGLVKSASLMAMWYMHSGSRWLKPGHVKI